MHTAQIVSVIVVTCAAEDYLSFSLDSIKEQTYSPLEIIVINNNPAFNFSQAFSKRYVGITVYSNPANLFYCAALNKGIHLSKGKFVLCLNDDVILDKNFIQEAVRCFEINPRIGMVSGKILRPNGITIDSTGLFLTSWRSCK